MVFLAIFTATLLVGCGRPENMTTMVTDAGIVTCIFNKEEVCVVREIYPGNTDADQAALFLKVGLINSLTGTTNELSVPAINQCFPNIKVGDKVKVVETSISDPHHPDHFDYSRVVQGLVK